MKSFLSLTVLASLSLTLAAHSSHHAHGSAHRRHQPETEEKQLEERATAYWLESITHQGIAPFAAGAASYKVFRNVKTFGAVGDGVADDTAAINLAISSGGRCAPSVCNSTTQTPALVYFPAGTYRVTSSIIDYYYTQLVGNPNSLPTIKADAAFPVSTTFGVIDGDQYGAKGEGFGSTNTFYRQIRNLIIDTTAIPASSAATGIHWPTAQATSIQNCIIYMNQAKGSLHRGIYIEDGSGGFLNDITTYGGINGAIFGNQQFTMRNLNIYNAQGAGISQAWDWGWTYKNINIYNCSVGIDMSALNGTGYETVGAITFLDGSITNTPIGFLTSYSSTTSKPPTAGSLIIENTVLKNVPIAVQGAGKVTALAGTTGTMTIAAWGQGHRYTLNQARVFQNSLTPFPRPTSLVASGKFYERSKPQYETYPLSSFVSVRTAGATGNGYTDDTAALNKIFKSAAAAGQIVFVDAGDYLVSSTILIPAGSKVVGEAYSVIIGSGSYFADIKNYQPVVRVGAAGSTGTVEWSDMIVSTRKATPGAVLIEWNVASPAATPSGMWDVHTRIGGFSTSYYQYADCPKEPTMTNYVNPNCIAAFASMHVTSGSSGLYMENVWLWTADHDLDDPQQRQISIFTGRGLFIESKVGNIWLVGTAVEHHSLYQYQFSGTQNVFAGQIQTETPYYQPNPAGTTPYAFNLATDPNFAVYCKGKTGNCEDAWGLRILNSQNLLFYGAGLYSFFDNYSTTCSAAGLGEACQTQIFGIDTGGTTEGPSGANSAVYVYNLNTIGSVSMVDTNGVSLAKFSDNINVFPDTIALYRSLG